MFKVTKGLCLLLVGCLVMGNVVFAEKQSELFPTNESIGNLGEVEKEVEIVDESEIEKEEEEKAEREGEIVEDQENEKNIVPSNDPQNVFSNESEIEESTTPEEINEAEEQKEVDDKTDELNSEVVSETEGTSTEEIPEEKHVNSGKINEKAVDQKTGLKSDAEKELVEVQEELTENAVTDEIKAVAVRYNITMSKTAQIIPKSATQDLVNKGIILYKVTVTATVKDSRGKAAANKAITFTPSKNSKVKQVSYDRTTNAQGRAKAYYEVRGITNFTSTARCMGVTKNFSTQPTEKCTYENKFYLTTYIIALESDYSSNKKVSADGISNYTFREEFLKAVKMNGAGYSSDNKFHIRYNSSTGKFEKGDPVTSSGTTPKAGRTIAVDNFYIPRYNTTKQYGCVSITSVGKRKAEDAGGAIKKYHIDVFMGTGKAAENKFSYNKQYKTVEYLGNNKSI